MLRGGKLQIGLILITGVDILPKKHKLCPYAYACSRSKTINFAPVLKHHILKKKVLRKNYCVNLKISASIILNLLFSI